jgi:hypothetical protein
MKQNKKEEKKEVKMLETEVFTPKEPDVKLGERNLTDRRIKMRSINNHRKYEWK